MSKKVTIPTDGGNSFVVILGGVKYVYKPGETVDVPDSVALEIEEWERWKDKYRGAVQPPFSAGGGGDGSSVQPDLSQNDPNAADYVKNRTHYSDEEILCDSDVTNPFVIGYRGTDRKMYIHEGACLDVYLSNGYVHVMDYDTLSGYKGTPSTYTINGTTFAMNWRIDTKSQKYVFTLTSNSDVTVRRKVYRRSTLKQLDEKYIPDAIQRVGGEVIVPSSTAGSTKKFKLTVDDGGTITATEIT